MLLEFRVTNYRCIRDEQCLSLIPIKRHRTLCNENLQSVESKPIHSVLRGSAIYGANASGKSTLLNAMFLMQSLVRDSATKVQAGQTLNTQGYAFDENLKSAPTSFELTAIVAGIRYQYGFSFTPERIQEEWLIVYMSNRRQDWFSRKWNQDSKQYEYSPFSSYLKGQKDLWKHSTRENALYLSTAVQLNSEQLRPLWNWIVMSLVAIPAQAPLNIDFTLHAIENSDQKNKVLKFLNSADIAIEDVFVKKQPAKRQNFSIDLATGKASVSDMVMDAEVRVAFFQHSVSGKVANFNFSDESSGTQRLFAFAGIILAVLDQGMTLVIDEIETSMHPLLVGHILKLFFSSDSNPLGAQIIFSTHNTTLLNNEVLRRDQIWFTEKAPDQATRLFPLSDFSPRMREAFAKGYLDGRYGAIPILDELHGAAERNARK